MKNKQLEKELVGLEHAFWRALRDGDVSAAVEMTDFPCILTGAQGVSSIDERAFTDMMKNPPYALDAYEIGPDVKVRLIDHDVAVVAYSVHEDVTVDGQRLSLDVADASTWVRRHGKWRCAQHTESILGDPFGRDRRS